MTVPELSLGDPALATVDVARGRASLSPAHDAVASAHPPPIDEPAEVMNVDEVATFLKVNRKTVYDYAARGEIPFRRLGRRLLFSRTALVSWLGGCKVASRAHGA